MELVRQVSFSLRITRSVRLVFHCMKLPVTEASCILWRGEDGMAQSAQKMNEGLDDQRIPIRGMGKRFFLHSLEAPKGTSSEVKRPGREADHLRLVQRLRIRGIILPLLHSSSWRGA
jgi:hypothetical protein